MAGDYKAYLLRLQRGEGQEHWRATLVEVISGEKNYFATERALFIHLMRILAEETLPINEYKVDLHDDD